MNVLAIPNAVITDVAQRIISRDLTVNLDLDILIISSLKQQSELIINLVQLSKCEGVANNSKNPINQILLSEMFYIGVIANLFSLKLT